MDGKPLSTTKSGSDFPAILPVRQRHEVTLDILRKRLDTLLPVAMRESGLDMWIVLCQEDDLDPAYTTLIPMDTWCPILQMLVFFDRGEAGIERVNISGTQTFDLYDWPYKGQLEDEQWKLLSSMIEERDPKRIGINTGTVAWAAGGLTHNLHTQLLERIPAKYRGRLESAERLVTRWASTLIDEELVLFEHAADVAHHVIAECYSRKMIIPGVTTTEDLRWHFWQRCSDMGMPMAFRPSFSLRRSDAAKAVHGEADIVIRRGDLVHCDVGLKYLGINTDMQEWVYVLREGETEAPAGLRGLMAEANRLQDIYMAEFKLGLTGNQLLANILGRARREGVPGPKVYSHSLGTFLHQPGPLIGLPWEQENTDGRGEVKLQYNNCFTMELSVTGPVPEWGGQELRLSMEEDVAYTSRGCILIDGRQTGFYLV
jgi:hypothetical protein